MFKTQLFIFEAASDRALEVTMEHGPRALGRALGATFGGDWDDRHRGRVAMLIADYTAGELHVADELRRELRRADLSVTFCP
jgi:hypothetical protein